MSSLACPAGFSSCDYPPSRRDCFRCVRRGFVGPLPIGCSSVSICPGDRVVFRLHCCGYLVPRTNTRMVRGVRLDGRIEVRFAGYDDFLLERTEVVAVICSGGAQ